MTRNMSGLVWDSRGGWEGFASAWLGKRLFSRTLYMKQQDLAISNPRFLPGSKNGCPIKKARPMQILPTLRRAFIRISMREAVMNDPVPMRRSSDRWPKLACLCALALVLALAKAVLAEKPLPDPAPEPLTLANAIASA